MSMLNSILWVLILIWVAWPVAGFCAFIYIFCAPFLACFDCCTGLVTLLRRGVEWPEACGKHIKGGDNVC